MHGNAEAAVAEVVAFAACWATQISGNWIEGRTLRGLRLPVRSSRPRLRLPVLPRSSRDAQQSYCSCSCEYRVFVIGKQSPKRREMAQGCSSGQW